MNNRATGPVVPQEPQQGPGEDQQEPAHEQLRSGAVGRRRRQQHRRPASRRQWPPRPPDSPSMLSSMLNELTRATIHNTDRLHVTSGKSRNAVSRQPSHVTHTAATANWTASRSLPPQAAAVVPQAQHHQDGARPQQCPQRAGLRQKARHDAGRRSPAGNPAPSPGRRTASSSWPAASGSTTPSQIARSRRPRASASCGPSARRACRPAPSAAPSGGRDTRPAAPPAGSGPSVANTNQERHVRRHDFFCRR